MQENFLAFLVVLKSLRNNFGKSLLVYSDIEFSYINLHTAVQQKKITSAAHTETLFDLPEVIILFNETVNVYRDEFELR